LAALTLPRPTEAEALSELQARSDYSLPMAPPQPATDALAHKLCRYFEGEEIDFDEPLDPTIGTDFQRRVWAITRAIPRGRVRTYGEIAREAGSPKATRAVGQAMARNPWPVIVPCHRVVGQNGQLTGFGGGVEMKRRMLEMEGALRSLRT
jgi:methylated-DNA-[protein]-cysteine S-methyltransferase